MGEKSSTEVSGEGDEWGQSLKSKYRPFDVETSIYTESFNVANGPLMFAQYICDALRPGDVPDNLKKLYTEAVYGSNPKVRARIVSHMYSIGRIVRYVIHSSQSLSQPQLF